MRLTVNGEEDSFRLGERTVQALVRCLGFVPEHVVVECNGEIYKGSDTQQEISDGDVIEIVRFVGGG
ncbi:MAG: sulfur carrier protein ThiS [bacterium]|nr:sulfur carrier protein ThiS [bacterium]